MRRIGQYIGDIFRVATFVYERGDVMSGIIMLLVPLVLWGLGLVGVHVGDFKGLEPWVNYGIPTLLLIYLFIVAPFRLWNIERSKVDDFEEAARPKIFVSEPIQDVRPRGAAGRAEQREWRIRLENTSTTTVKGCFVQMKSFINVKHEQSSYIATRFKFSNDQPRNIKEHKHRQSVDIPPGSFEMVSIVGLNELYAPPSPVVMLYANDGSGGELIGNAISQSVFPHTLIIQVCAENLAVPVEVTYRIYINGDGILKMERQP